MGSFSGYENSTGSDNVFIGYQSGYHEKGSNKLIIDNNRDNYPLIYGEFNRNSVSIGTKYSGTDFKLVVSGKVRSSGYVTVSDERLKENISHLDGALSRLQKVEGVTYSYKSDSSARIAISSDNVGEIRYGFLAQNIRESFPELVFEEDGLLAVDYQGMIPVLTEAIKEITTSQAETVKALVSENVALENEIATLKNEMMLIKKELGMRTDVASEKEIALQQNHPNPFSETTKVSYNSSKKAGQVSMVVTNISGLEVMRFDNLSKGKGQVEIPSKNLASGIYIYTLVEDGKPVSSKKNGVKSLISFGAGFSRTILFYIT